MREACTLQVVIFVVCSFDLSAEAVQTDLEKLVSEDPRFPLFLAPAFQQDGRLSLIVPPSSARVSVY